MSSNSLPGVYLNQNTLSIPAQILVAFLIALFMVGMRKKTTETWFALGFSASGLALRPSFWSFRP
jgi:hypothetical protein